jgi:3'(2'), 5'-bisphosphate nucleotidase
MNDHELAADIAHRAGRILIELRARLHDPSVDVKVLRDEADRGSQQAIAGAIDRARPGDAVLSEEAVDDPARLSADRVWIVDPLDGTREFAERGRTDWAVHVALVEDGQLRVGAVALPARDLVLSTWEPPKLAAPVERPRLVVSRTRPPAVTETLREALDAELVPMGSAGAKTSAIILGDADVYAHAGGQYEWDSAAPVAVAAAAGLHVSRLDGSPLRYNRPDPWLPDLLVCRPELAERVITAAA